MTITPDTHNTPEAMDAFWASVDDGYFDDREWMYIYIAWQVVNLSPGQPEVEINICDFGCGCGHLLRRLDKLFRNAQLYGVDYSEEAIWKASGDFIALLLHSDLCDLSGLAGNHFHVGTCVQTLEHVQDYRTALAQMMRVMKPGGSLILTVPNNDGWKGHHNHWTPETFRELLETYGEVAECMTFGRNEGDDTNILARVVKV